MAPIIVDAVSDRVAPKFTGPLLLAVGVAGMALTSTIVESAGLVIPFTVAVTKYVPLIAVVALALTVGFC